MGAHGGSGPGKKSSFDPALIILALVLLALIGSAWFAVTHL